MTRQDQQNKRFQLRKNIKLLSLDVFDTLFHRVCNPDALIELSCKLLALKLGLPPETVVKVRFEAAKKLREQTAGTSPDNDHEYLFDDLVQPMATELNKVLKMGREELCQIVSDSLSLEIQLEKGAIFPNHEMIKLARDTKSSGIDICATSDMYHSRDTIHGLLGAVGADDLFNPEDIFVSAEHSATKYSQRLFKKVAAVKGIDLNQVAHIGDNPKADIGAPAALGIQVFNYDADRHHRRYSEGRNATNDARLLPHVAHTAGLEALDKDNIHDRIASALAPALCYFTIELAETVLADARSSVWFMARDGYLLKRLYDTLNTGNLPPSAYLYVSRKSTSPASSLTYGIREAFLAEWNGENRQVQTMLSPIGLCDEHLSELLRSYGFENAEEELAYVADPRLVALLNDPTVTKAMQDTGNEARQRLNLYLKRTGFTDQTRPAVVDVGWAGQIQEAVQFAMNRSQKFDMKGYYIAVRHLGGLRRLAGVSMKGLLSDCSKPDPWADSILSAVDVFEDACRASHGTVLGYDEVGNPVLADARRQSFQNEQGDNPRIAALQDAIIRYASIWFKTYRLFDAKPETFKQFALDATTFLTRFPTKEQATYFQSLAHGLDFSNDTLTTHSRTRTIDPLKARRMLRTSRWKEATATCLPFSPVLQAVLYLIKARRQSKAVALPIVTRSEINPNTSAIRAAFDPEPAAAEIDIPASSPGHLYNPGFRERLIKKITALLQ